MGRIVQEFYCARSGDGCGGYFLAKVNTIKEAKEHSGTMQKSYVYDDKGQCVWSGGTF